MSSPQTVSNSTQGNSVTGPKTPTKFNRRPGQKPQSAQAESTGKSAKSTPRSPAVKKPIPPSRPNTKSDDGEVFSKAQKPAAKAQKQDDDTTDDVESQAEQAPHRISMTEHDDDEGDSDDEPTAQVGKAGGQAREGLQQADPDPISDPDDTVQGAEEGDDDEEGEIDENDNDNQAADQATNDLTGKADKTAQSANDAAKSATGAAKSAGDATKSADGATKSAGDTAKSVGGTAKSAGDATKSANGAAKSAGDTAKSVGGTAKSADETAKEKTEQPQQQKQQRGGLLSGARSLATRASGIAGKAGKFAGRTAQDPSGAPANAKDTVQDTTDEAKATADNAQDTARQGVDQAQDAAGQAADQVGSAAESAQDAAKGAGDQVQGQAHKATDQLPDGVKDHAQGATDSLANGVREPAEGAVDGVKDHAKGAAGGVKGQAEDAVEGVKDQAEDAVDGAKDQADGVKDQAEGALDGVQDQAGDAVNGVKDQAEGAVDGVKDQAEGVTDGVKDQAESAVNGVKDQAEGAKDQAEGAVDGVKDQAEEAADGVKESIPMPEGLPIDLSVLKGLEVQSDGNIVDQEGNPIGRLAEGDAEDLEGYPIGDDGEILDEDGDLVGRVELLPDEIKKQVEAVRDEGGELPEGADEYLSQFESAAHEAQDGVEDATSNLPGLNILQGLRCQIDGLVYDDDGNTVGKVVEGDPEELQNAHLNDQGEFVDEEGNILGRAELHEEVEQLVEQGIYEPASAAQGAADDAADEAEGAIDEAEGAGDEVADGIEDQLPGIEALEGRELNEAGEVLDEQGNLLGGVSDDELKEQILDGQVDPNELRIDENGNVVDKEGNVLGRMELAEGAAEMLAEQAPQLDLRILEGKKINKRGKILDGDGEEIGELADGELEDCVGKKVNDKGEVLDKKGEVIGHVQVVPGEPAQTATYELLEELGELPEQAQADAEETVDLSFLEGYKVNKRGQIINEDGEQIGELADGDLKECAGKKINDNGEVLDKDGNIVGHVQALAQESDTPDLSILDGYKVNKKGQIVNEDGDLIGELADGELSECAGKKVNDQGEVLDASGNVIGRVNLVQSQDAEEEQKEEGEGEGEGEEAELPPLSVLEGYTVNKAGNIVDDNDTVIGRLVEGDAKRLSKAKIACDAEGQFWDNKGHIIGRAETVPVEEPEEEAPFAGLEGLQVVQDGWVQDENGNTVGYVVEGDAKKLLGRVVDEDGDILDKKGTVVGHAERYEEEGEEAQPPVDMSFLQGKTVTKTGLVIGDDSIPVARLVEGNAKDLVNRQLDAQGQFWNDTGKVIGRVELIPEEEREQKPEGPFAGLEDLRVIEGGKIADEDGNVVGEIVEGNAKRMIGLAVDEDGDIIDKYGNVKGRAEPLPEEEPTDFTVLDGLKLNKLGNVVDASGVPVGRLVDGNPSQLAGRQCDENGYIHNDNGKVVGRCEPLPEEERVAKPEGPFAGLQGLRVVKDGQIADEDGNIVGEITEGNAKRLVGLTVDEDGDIIDKYGNTKGHAEPLVEEEQEEVDNSMLNNKSLNKQGYVVDENGIPFGRLIEGNTSDLVGRKCDENGYIYGDTGKVVGRCEILPENERVARPEGPFAGLEGLRVVKDGFVEDADGNRVGEITEGQPKRLVGLHVDEDGDIIDKYGNVKGHAEPWEEEEVEEEAVDLSALAGTAVNKAGYAVDGNGTVVGRVAEGDAKTLIGKKVDGQGQIWDDAGNVIGRCELVHGVGGPEGPFAGFDGLQIQKDGTVTTQAGDIVGRVIEGDIKKLLGHTVDEDGDITDKNGNTIGKAERWEPEEKERRTNPMAGMRINKEGEVRDQNGDLVGRLTQGDLGHCVGQEIDEAGNVVDVDGNKIGEATLIENIAEDEFEGPSEEELAEAAKREEERQIAQKMSGICTQTLEKVQPICKQISEHMERADRTPKDELDEEELVNQVKPLIEEAGKYLQECNGSLRGLDPDGHIAAQAKGRAGTGEATPEEHRLAETLKELTTTVVTTIDGAKKKLNNMPHAKKKLNPLWSLMTQPLFQILAAVGLLLVGVLGLVGQLLNALGLGALVNGLLGGLGIDKLLSSFGLGGGDEKKKKGSPLSSVPVVGGLLEGKA